MGLYLGELMGKKLLEMVSTIPLMRFYSTIICSKRNNSEGYNQAALICQGISLYTNIPVLNSIACS
jgi:hypothetical protein